MVKFIKSFIVLILTLVILKSTAQNLVPNPDFEQYDFNNISVTEMTSKMSGVKFWYQPSAGTSDYYHPGFNSIEKSSGYPYQRTGFQLAHSGVSYAGIILSVIYRYPNQISSYREYIQIKLLDSLRSGKKYDIHFWTNLGDLSHIATSSIGALFSTDSLIQKGAVNIASSNFQVDPQFDNSENSLIRDSINWILVKGTFIAKGGEKYLTIGNFKDDEHTKRVILKQDKQKDAIAYYHIDDVSVTEVKEGVVEKERKESNKSNLLPGDSVILRSVLFEKEKPKLLPVSFIELKQLVSFLNEHPDVRMEICGHTDNRGNEKENLKLSKVKAKAVMDYMRKQGADKKRLTYFGYGGSRPIVSNSNKEDQSQNNRIECKIIPIQQIK